MNTSKLKAASIRLNTRKYKKKAIPAAIRQQVWISRCGEVFRTKCNTTWCNNIITVYDFHCGHNIPEVRGGKTSVENLIPICSNCNLSMGHHYTFEEWCANFGGSGEASGTKGLVPVVSQGFGGFCCGLFSTNRKN